MPALTPPVPLPMPTPMHSQSSLPLPRCTYAPPICEVLERMAKLRVQARGGHGGAYDMHGGVYDMYRLGGAMEGHTSSGHGGHASVMEGGPGMEAWSGIWSHPVQVALGSMMTAQKLAVDQASDPCVVYPS